MNFQSVVVNLSSIKKKKVPGEEDY